MIDPACELCEGQGWVCENHATRPFDDGPNACDCGGAGMPCVCNDCIPPAMPPGTVVIASVLDVRGH